VDYDPARSGGLSLEQWGDKYLGGTVRHWVGPGEGIADMAAEAGHRALADARLAAEAIELLVMATLSTHLPQASANVQARLGLGAKFIQLDSGCSGFVDALMVADSLMDRHRYETALVIGGDTSSSYLHPRHFMLDRVRRRRGRGGPPPDAGFGLQRDRPGCAGGGNGCGALTEDS
jgi:3-oxoacyl-[acyl-carrier-protein] synthase-3